MQSDGGSSTAGSLARLSLICAVVLLCWAAGSLPIWAEDPTPTPIPAHTWEEWLAIEEEMASPAIRREILSLPRILTYIVRPGDTVFGIAQRFGLDIDTIRWSNPELERNPDYLRPGTALTILPVEGVYHQVAAGDTLESVARRYGVAVEDIINYPLNHLDSADSPLEAGTWLIVPHGTKRLARPKPSPVTGYLFAWPIVGTVTQGYSAGHRAVDIGAPYGSPVYAARAGVVVHAGWSETGYGYTLIIDHGDGYRTLYSHLKGTWVSKGQKVAGGQLIGEVGSTGNSSGPHVHFEIRLNNARLNPLDYLPPQ
ncbi:MAG: peptidoglycan DD-metalloendopeptidase family protein [Anaerolineae bacterium]